MATGVQFPHITSQSLAGNTVTLPDDVMGKVTLIAIAFERNAQAMIDSWIKEVESEFEDDKIWIFEIPMIDSPIWRPMRAIIDSGMRGGIPRHKHGHVITYYGDSTTFRSLLGMEDRSLAYIYLLDDEGIIRWEGEGFASREDLESLFSVIRSLLSGT
jgi:hypothetical protein